MRNEIYLRPCSGRPHQGVPEAHAYRVIIYESGSDEEPTYAQWIPSAQVGQFLIDNAGAKISSSNSLCPNCRKLFESS